MIELMELPAPENELSRRVIGAAIEVHRELGPGLLESINQEALALELLAAGMAIKRHADVPVRYKGKVLSAPLQLDMVVNDAIIVELKSVERLADVHEAQLLSYLRLSRRKLGLLINFNTQVLTRSVRRVVNGL
jgi:GxxExxY protein